MLKITKNSTIYIICPYLKKTGGIEALHQLCDALLHENLDAQIVYLSKSVANTQLQPIYQNYNINSKTTNFEYKPENIIIVPEILTTLIPRFKDTQTVIWWLSVDNNKFEDGTYAFKDFDHTNIIHCYQSYYAQDYLDSNNVKNHAPLFDYINIPKQKKVQKKNQICYNPLKGYNITKQIISKLKDTYTFIKLENLSKDDLSKTLAESKLYIDFGHNPGKDRIPREAILNNTLTLTSYCGAAGFNQDLPIPNYYKTEINNIPLICNKIQSCMKNATNWFEQDFISYQNIIKNEKNQFFSQVKSLFNSVD